MTWTTKPLNYVKAALRSIIVQILFYPGSDELSDSGFGCPENYIQGQTTHWIQYAFSV